MQRFLLLFIFSLGLSLVFSPLSYANRTTYITCKCVPNNDGVCSCPNNDENGEWSGPATTSPGFLVGAGFLYLDGTATVWTTCENADLDPNHPFSEYKTYSITNYKVVSASCQQGGDIPPDECPSKGSSSSASLSLRDSLWPQDPHQKVRKGKAVEGLFDNDAWISHYFLVGEVTCAFHNE
jgi:hypothetical protein